MEPVEPDAQPDIQPQIDTPTDPSPDDLSKFEKLKATQKKLTERVERTRADLEERRKTNSALDTALATMETDNVAGGAVLAGAVAFRIFLFQIPYVFVVVSIVGWIADSSDSASVEVNRTVGIGSLTASAIGSTTGLSTWTRLWSLCLGTFALFLGARTLVKVVRVVHILVWKVPPKKAKSSTRAALAFILVITAALAVSALTGRVRADTFVGGLLLLLIADGAFGAVFVLVELRMPRPPDTTWKDLVPGGVLFGFGVLALHVFTVYWISYSLDSKSDTYGAIGASLSLLLWAYLLGRLLTTSIVLNQVRWSRNQLEAAQPLPSPPPLPAAPPMPSTVPDPDTRSVDQ